MQKNSYVKVSSYEARKGEVKKVVLLYSGGLDTSVMLKKAQAQATAGKLYAQKIYEMVMALSSGISQASHPLLKKPEKLSGRKLVVFLSSNKGLCGGLNTNLFRFFLHTHQKASSYDCVTLGKKGVSFITQIGSTIKADFSDTSSVSSIVPAVTDLIAKEYIAGSYDAVELVYNEFVTIMRQEPRSLPVAFTSSPAFSFR